MEFQPADRFGADEKALYGAEIPQGPFELLDDDAASFRCDALEATLQRIPPALAKFHECAGGQREPDQRGESCDSPGCGRSGYLYLAPSPGNEKYSADQQRQNRQCKRAHQGTAGISRCGGNFLPDRRAEQRDRFCLDILERLIYEQGFLRART